MHPALPSVPAQDAHASAQRLLRIGYLKGRQVATQALAELCALIGNTPPDGHRRDLLIEHLHLLNDHYHALFERHLVALAYQMNLPMVEVFEVASFYHHFEILPDDQPPAALKVRLCDGQSCEMAGSGNLLQGLAVLDGRDVKVYAV
jgi:formate dehydrogenase